MYLDIVCVTRLGDGVMLFAGEGQEQSENCRFPWYKELVLFKLIQSCNRHQDMLERFFGARLNNLSRDSYW